MYKQIMLLGLLMEQPMYGQQIREVIETHHSLFADFIKKPTIYYQLERLAQEGFLEIRHELIEAPGTGYAHEELAPREREVYYITDAGRQRFHTLLREQMETYTPQLSDIDACVFFLHYLSPSESHALLSERYKRIAAYRDSIVEQIQLQHVQDAAHQLVNDHKLTLLDAELDWLKRTMEHLRQDVVQPAKMHHPTQ